MTAIARVLLDVLLASVWQGVCIALVAAALLFVAGRRANAATRCSILQIALVAMVLAPVVSTLPNVIHGSVTAGGYGIVGDPGASAAKTAISGPFAFRRIDVVLGDGAVLALVTAWIFGVTVFALRICGGYLQLRRIVRNGERLADRGDVRMYRSSELRVPFAFGFRAPSIVLPSELLARNAEELDNIVLHELAHVRRGDTWANACERGVAALLFFNPAVRLVLRAIAFERESACDDRAVAESGDLDAYTYALATFAVSALDSRSLAACGANGFARGTAGRIKRLEDARRNGATTLSRFALGGCTIVLALFALTVPSFAPAIAFEATSPQKSAPVLASLGCKDAPVRYAGGPAPNGDFGSRKVRTTLNVRVSSTGKVVFVAIRTSSGNARFDQAVIASAKAGTWTPAMRDCQAVPGSYVFLAEAAP